jgi:hypothetical protein
MQITIDGNGIITGAATLATTVANPTFTTPNINSAQFATVSGTAPIYPCRAWVNFNGTGTVAIRASGNVTSITDNGTGDYTVNFTTALPDANYAAVGIGPNIANSGGAYQLATNDAAAPTSSQYRVNVQTAGGAQSDRAYIFMAFFR